MGVEEAAQAVALRCIEREAGRELAAVKGFGLGNGLALAVTGRAWLVGLAGNAEPPRSV
jgi:hypothetical protein